jgi:hypothetical protein
MIILSSSGTPPARWTLNCQNEMRSMPKHIHVKASLPDQDDKRVEAAKTARLRAFRLAKEAADRDATNREIATAPPRGRGRQPNHPTSNVSWDQDQISGLAAASTQTGQPNSSKRSKLISYSTAAALPNASAEAPSKLLSATSPWRRKRNEATIESAQRITTSMRNTISANVSITCPWPPTSCSYEDVSDLVSRAKRRGEQRERKPSNRGTDLFLVYDDPAPT